MLYSRNILLSLRNCWKSTSQPNLALPNLLLPRCVWENLKSLNLLAPRRGCRGGKNRQVTITTGLSTPIPNLVLVTTISTTAVKPANLHNLLNIHSNTSSMKISRQSFHGFPKVFLSNTRSHVNKTEELSTTIHSLNPDIPIVTETWLSSSITDELTNILQYSVSGKDRPFDIHCKSFKTHPFIIP